ncbi:MAG: peptidylprolyl isomerase [Burkholderiales bacterium]|nr:peptidylprolyl isomerase [Burkholderiales bacterium]
MNHRPVCLRPSFAARRGPALRRAAALLAALAFGSAVSAQPSQSVAPLNGDYIAAVVNQELVTAGELERRIESAKANATRQGMRLPPASELRRQVFDALIEERVIITVARESGVRVDEAEIDRAVQSVAAQNRFTMAQLRERLRADGSDLTRFRATLRDQLLIEKLREREVYPRIRVSDEEVEQYLARQRESAAADVQINLAQILVTVPEGAGESMVATRRAHTEAALARVRAGEAFDRVARELSEDGNRERGGEIGLRPASRLPDLFTAAVKDFKVGQVSAAPLRSGAGFHILKLLERRGGEAGSTVTQTRARHLLLRTSPQLSADVATRRLSEYRAAIEAGQRTFEDLARQFSEDGSSAAGGDLGWTTPGTMVPEFEAAMNALAPGGMSAPVLSRFGVHLIQVLERREAPLDVRQMREQARNVLREQKFEQAYMDWAKELRTRAYIELREPPQ